MANGDDLTLLAIRREYGAVVSEKRVSLSWFQDRRLLHVRLWEWDDKKKALVPGFKGVAFSPDEIPQLKAAIGEAEAILAKEGLLVDSNLHKEDFVGPEEVSEVGSATH